ncbi:MAG: PIN domain-containing protein, partial [Candidatus Acidiferrales bacterium]
LFVGPFGWLDIFRKIAMTSASFRPQLTNKPILRVEKITNHPNRPLLVSDGDSFAHRAYHAVPKSIHRRGNKGGGAIVGFANFLLRLYEGERPRAVLVGWDTLDVLTYRHRAFAAYQSGRQFDAELRDQLDVLPHFVTACGFVSAKSPGYEADDFLAAAVASEELRGGKAIVATGDRDAFQLASEMTTILQPVCGELLICVENQ